jgi:4-amino-4-deoxy-L-arabinose transferase-like glycosyltransferase
MDCLMHIPEEFRRMKRFAFSAVWLGFLTVYILLGVPITSYHGDETTLLYSTHDYVTLFIQRNPQALLVEWPIDNELEYISIASSSLGRFTTGFGWHVAGFSEDDLPRENFDWNLDYYSNYARGLIPNFPLMVAMRLPSAIFLALSAVAMFGIGYYFGGLPMAVFVSALYAFNPVILLNGRRALQEGALLCFGLFTILLGIIISQRRERGKTVGVLWWVALTLASGFTLASKNNGFIYITAAFLWIGLPELLRPRLSRIVRTGMTLTLCGVAVIALFIVLSPALWSDPPARLRDATAARLSAMNGQMRDDPEAPSSMERRVTDILTQPFMRPLAHYEGAYSNTYTAQLDLIAAYEASPLSGIHFGALLGGALTGLALFGVIANFTTRLRTYRSPALSLGLTAWLLVNLGPLLWVPLPWQRYFLSIIPVYSLFAAVGLWSLVGLVQRRRKVA